VRHAGCFDPSHFSLGYVRPGPDVTFGSSPRAFGHPGAGGSFAFADPDVRVGYAYAMNKMDFYLIDDPREKALRDATYRAIGGSHGKLSHDGHPRD
jgi:CubicO group peptidase (beta-lactamase class C family)